VSYLHSQTIYHALAYAKTSGTPDTIVLTTPQEPYVCIGFHRDLEKEVDLHYCEENNIPVIRRETGGGTVYLDDQQLFLQWIFQPKRLPLKHDQKFRLFNQPLMETYKFFGINAHFHPPNDVCVREKKIVGTGAAAIGNAEVVTGNFLFDFDCEKMAKVLNVPDENFRRKIYQSLQKYLTTFQRELKMMPDKTKVAEVYFEKCAEALGAEIVRGDFTESELRMMEKLDKKFVTKEWLYDYKTTNSRGRLVKIHAKVWLGETVFKTKDSLIRTTIRLKGNRIDDISFSGDFDFQPASKLRSLEKVLAQVELKPESLREMLAAFFELHQVETRGIAIEDWVAAILMIKENKELSFL